MFSVMVTLQLLEVHNMSEGCGKMMTSRKLLMPQGSVCFQALWMLTHILCGLVIVYMNLQ
jgi:hypothetical protein